MKKILFSSLLILSTLLLAQGEEIPTKKSSWAIEVNPLRLLLLESDWQSFSGTISHFDNETGIEIAMPIFYSKEKDDYNYRNDDNYIDTETVLNIDLDYRKYFSGNRTEGGFIGAFGRYTYLDGKVWNKAKYATVNKFGIGGTIGFKVKDIFNTPFYWGMSLKLGGYVGSDNDIFNSSGIALGIDDNKLILDAEILKVGYEF